MEICLLYKSYDYDISRLSIKKGRMEKELIKMNLAFLKIQRIKL